MLLAVLVQYRNWTPPCTQ